MHFPVLCLLGEPGIGKSTVISQETQRLLAAAQKNDDRVLWVDLASCGTDVMVCRRIFESREFRDWKKGQGRLHMLLDGFDTCLQNVPTIVAFLLERFEQEPRDRLLVRIACRTAEWPADLEAGLQRLWHHQEFPECPAPVGIFELAPLRKDDVRTIAEACRVCGEAFLKEVKRVGAHQFANRPMTFRFLLNLFRSGKGIPVSKVDLYREGCLVLCDEHREDVRRDRKVETLSSGLRFAVAGRLAAVSVFCRRTAIWMAPRGDAMPTGDVRRDELLGRQERFNREVTDIEWNAVRETVNTGLFRSIGPHRLCFSHRTYTEYLAAQYIVDHQLSVSEILRLILHSNGSGKVVPQLRETAAWLAALVPDIRRALLSKDPTALFASDTPPSGEDDRRQLVRQILRLYDTGELLDLRIVSLVGAQQEGARLQYTNIAGDLRPYIVDKSHNATVRLAAIKMAQFSLQVELQEDVLRTALDGEESHDVRVAATIALRTIGGDRTTAALKPLVVNSSIDDPDDELKGAALAAMWPEHLTPGEFFDALTPPKKRNFTGEYQRFLWSRFADSTPLHGMTRALQWARHQLVDADAEHQPTGSAALSVVAAAIDCSHDPQVLDQLADILVHLAVVPIPSLRVMTKLSTNRDARSAIERAIRGCPNQWTARRLRDYCLVAERDVAFLLDELDAAPSRHAREKIGLQIASILDGVPQSDVDLFDRVMTAANANAILLAALRPALGPVELASEEAGNHKAQFESGRPRQDPTPESPAPTPDLDDLIAQVEKGNVLVFVDICHRLAGTSWYPNEGVLPGWNNLQSRTQTQIVRAAELYLNGYCVAHTSWIDTGEGWYTVTCGYWALRLLTQVAQDTLHNLSADVWYAWMPSVFADSYMRQTPDAVQRTILKNAYQRAPARFWELLDRFVHARDQMAGDVLILEKVAPVLDNKFANLLRNKLEDDALGPHAFGSILDFLMTAGDDGALQIANGIVTGVSDALIGDFDRPVQVALELLNKNAVRAWKVVWPAARKNAEFAKRLFARYATESHAETTTNLLHALEEDQLADLYIWISQQDGAFTAISSAWSWFRVAVANTLVARGTPAVIEAIRQMHKKAPDENLKCVEQAAQEVLRRKTWAPLSPAELIDLVTGQRALQRVKANASK